MLIIRRILLALFLTTVVFVIGPVIDRLLNPPTPLYATPFNTFGFILTVGSTLTLVFVGLPNVLLLVLLYYTNIAKEYLNNIKFLILEICLYRACNFLVGITINKLIESLPVQEVFSKDGGRKFYFTEVFQFVWTFIILFLLLLVIKKTFISRKVNEVLD